MEPFHIYGKTELGTSALNAARGAIGSPARQLLILIDGQRDVGELRSIFGAEALGRLLPQLEAQGYVRRLRDAPGGRPATISTVQRVPAAEGAAPRNIEPPTAADVPSNVLPKAALAAVVVAVSGAIWWFLGGAAIPGIPSAPAPAASTAPTGNAPSAADTTATAAVETISPAPAPELTAPGSNAASGDRVASRPRDASRTEPRADNRAAAAPPTPADAASRESASPQTASAPRPSASRAGPGIAANEPTRTAAPAPGAGASLAAGTPVSAAAAVPPPAPSPALIQGPAQPASVATTSSTVGVSPSGNLPATGSVTPSAAAPGIPSARPASPVPPAASTSPQLHPRERTMPVLSRTARRAGIDSGQLVVRLHVSPRGTVESVDVLKANPREVYDSTIEQTLKKWTFDPPGVPVESTVEFEFKS